MSPSRMSLTPILLASLCLSGGCAGMVDRAVVRRAVPQLALQRDLPLACSFGELGAGAVPVVSGDRSQQALTVGWTISGLCAELDGWEHGLDSQLALVNAPADTRAAMAMDARIAAIRAHTLAATRYQAGYRWALSRFGDATDCKLRNDWDASAYMLGLLSGVLALVNDAVAEQAVGVPQNQLLDVARAADCLDDDRWWGIPSGVQHAAWAVVPGSAPDGVDPWAGLRAAAEKGDAVGQGIPRALWLFTAANAGDAALVREILEGWPALSTAPTAQWPLLDAYARAVAQHESDLLWIAAEGHRAPSPPAPPAGAAPAADPFAGDNPFGSGPADDNPFDVAPTAPDALPQPPDQTE